jgi:hypothetical protein
VLLPKLLALMPSASSRFLSVQGVEISLTPIAGLYGTRKAMNRKASGVARSARLARYWPVSRLMCALLISQHRL